MSGVNLDDYWVPLSKAPAQLERPKSTIYKWIENGEIRTMRPLHEQWLYVPDLLRMNAATPRRRRKSMSGA